MTSTVTETRRALEVELCNQLGISQPQAAMLIERMLDFFKDMRMELRKADELRNTHTS
ncbi:hypothetical protein CRP235_gp03 [Roseobacter phage CRP-235]|nr:hypothetical protein CRP235_gp03 [Roseobacter phage CRP-235]